jgi:hypothetical protein
VRQRPLHPPVGPLQRQRRLRGRLRREGLRALHLPQHAVQVSRQRHRVAEVHPVQVPLQQERRLSAGRGRGRLPPGDVPSQPVQVRQRQVHPGRLGLRHGQRLRGRLRRAAGLSLANLLPATLPLQLRQVHTHVVAVRRRSGLRQQRGRAGFLQPSGVPHLRADLLQVQEQQMHTGAVEVRLRQRLRGRVRRSGVRPAQLLRIRVQMRRRKVTQLKKIYIVLT